MQCVVLAGAVLACLLSGGVLPVPFTCAPGERRASSASRVARSLWTVAWERSVNRPHTPDSPRSTPAGGVAVRRQLPTTRGSWVVLVARAAPQLWPSCHGPPSLRAPRRLHSVSLLGAAPPVSLSQSLCLAPPTPSGPRGAPMLARFFAKAPAVLASAAEPSASTPAQPSTETHCYSTSATRARSPQKSAPLETLHVEGHLMRLLCRLKPACPGRTLAPSMDPGHILAELVIGRGLVDHRRTIVGPVCELTYRMHRRVTLTQFFASFFAIWWWDLASVWTLLSSSPSPSI